MKKEYVAPTLDVEILSAVDSMCASIQCVGYDNVADTTETGGTYGEGFVYMKGGQPYYCYGIG